MKVVHINTNSTGGAALCMFRIHNALLSHGVDSKVLVATSYPNCYMVKTVSPDPYPWHTNFFIRKWQVIKCRMERWPKSVYYRKLIQEANTLAPTLYTSPITDYQSLYFHPWVQDADIVHLHWIADFVDYNTFFANVRKPIVWTMHDENPGYGGFHYAPKDDKINSAHFFLEKQFLNIKKKAIENANITFVSISSIMRKFAQNNAILKKQKEVLIHNGVDEKEFKLIDKSLARKALGLNPDKKYFMFSSFYIWEERKGLRLLIQALEELNLPNVELLCVGNVQAPIIETKIPNRCFGFISDAGILSLIYSASDFFVIPSFQESFAQTPLEAMACGTPVIGFPCGVVPELINNINGIVTKEFSVPALKDSIMEVVDKEFDGHLIRESVLQNYSMDFISNQYKQLYQSLLR